MLCGLFAAVNAIGSFISVPLGFTPVPVNLATLAVFLTGGILGARYGTISEIVYVLVGAVGIPVFAGFRGGVSVLAGPTVGYIIGYIAAALVVGILTDRCFRSRKSSGSTYAFLTVSMIAGLAACYLLGTVWFIISTGTGVWASLVACVFPFLIGDALKIIAAVILVKKLRPILR